jgi:hypothetical protein
MNPFALLLIQLAMSFAAAGLFAKRVALPWLATRSREEALAPLLWVHVFRYLPLGLLAPGQVDVGAPQTALVTIAAGDWAASILALVALSVLYTRGTTALGWAWLFAVVSVLDIVVALTLGLGAGIYRHPLGVGWFVLTVYVPVVVVAQVLMGAVLLRKQHAAARGAA